MEPDDVRQPVQEDPKRFGFGAEDVQVEDAKSVPSDRKGE